MASPTYVGSTLGATGNGSSASLPRYSSTQADDIILVQIYKENTAAITPETGFSALASSNHTGFGFVQYWFWKRAVAGDNTGSNFVFSWTGSTYRESCLVVYRGALTGASPWDGTPASPTPVTATTITNPAVTTSVAETLIVTSAASFSDQSDPWSATNSGGATVSSAVNSSELHVAHFALAAAGSSGTVTHTSQVNTGLTGIISALKPAAGGGATSFLLPPRVRAYLPLLVR